MHRCSCHIALRRELSSYRSPSSSPTSRAVKFISIPTLRAEKRIADYGTASPHETMAFYFLFNRTRIQPI